MILLKVFKKVNPKTQWAKFKDDFLVAIEHQSKTNVTNVVSTNCSLRFMNIIGCKSVHKHFCETQPNKMVDKYNELDFASL